MDQLVFEPLNGAKMTEVEYGLADESGSIQVPRDIAGTFGARTSNRDA